MDLFSVWHLLILLAIVLVLFGTAKLRNIGSDLGGAIKNFKQAVKSGDSDDAEEAQTAKPARPGVLKKESRVIDAQATPVKKPASRSKKSAG